jgi:hypothetical protein
MKLFFPDSLWNPNQISGSSFLFFHDEKIGFSLHPSVSSNLTSMPSSIPESLKGSISSLPGVKLDRVGQMAEVFVTNLVVPDGRWAHHRELGWINNWRHSQRNPESSMSLLREADFRFIEEFFAENASSRE